MAEPNGWQEWSKFVLRELTRLSNAYEDLTKKVNDEMSIIKAEIAMLKVKSGVYGLVGGAILVLIFLLSRYFPMGGG